MKLTSKGQLTIPKKLREKFGLSPTTDVDVVADGNALRIVKRGPGTHPVDLVEGILKRPGSTDKIIRRLRGA